MFVFFRGKLGTNYTRDADSPVAVFSEPESNFVTTTINDKFLARGDNLSKIVKIRQLILVKPTFLQYSKMTGCTTW